MISSVIERLLRIEDNARLMRFVRRIALVVDILSLVVPIVLYNCGIIGAAPAGMLTMLSIFNVSQAILSWANRIHDTRIGGQRQRNNSFGDGPDDMSA